MDVQNWENPTSVETGGICMLIEINNISMTLNVYASISTSFDA